MSAEELNPVGTGVRVVGHLEAHTMIRFDDELLERIKIYADEDQRTVASWIRTEIKRVVSARDDQRAREELQADIDDRLRNLDLKLIFEETGQIYAELDENDEVRIVDPKA